MQNRSTKPPVKTQHGVPKAVLLWGAVPGQPDVLLVQNWDRRFDAALDNAYSAWEHTKGGDFYRIVVDELNRAGYKAQFMDHISISF